MSPGTSITIRPATRITLFAALLIGAAFLLSGCMTDREQAAFAFVNAERHAAGRPALVEDAELTFAARAFADQLAREGGLRHSDLRRIAAGGKWKLVGENVGVVGDSGYAERSMQHAFRSSPPHLAIQRGDFSHGGIGLAVSSDGRVFQVQLFGRRSGS